MNNKQIDTIFTYFSHQQISEPYLDILPSERNPSKAEVLEIFDMILELLNKVSQLGLRNSAVEHIFAPRPHHQHGTHHF